MWNRMLTFISAVSINKADIVNLVGRFLSTNPKKMNKSYSALINQCCFLENYTVVGHNFPHESIRCVQCFHK